MKRFFILCAVVLLLSACTSKEDTENYGNIISELRTDNEHFEAEIEALNGKVEEYKGTISDLQAEIEKNENKSMEYDDSSSLYGGEVLAVGDDAKTLLNGMENEVLEILSRKDMAELSKYVHPAAGVRLSPYSYVNPNMDIVFTSDALKIDNILSVEKLWGYYDGSGEQMQMSFDAYYDKFLYSADYLNAEDITYNEPHSTGNMIDNHYEIYGPCISVDFHFDGFNEEYEGMDWETLRLVFKEYEGEYYLIGIIHNQWTI